MSSSVNDSQEKIDLVVDFIGLVKIFGEALYKDFQSLIRELVQNGHDGIIKKHAIGDVFSTSLSKDRVVVIYDERKGTLVVADTGIGMSRNELANELNNFASSGKRLLQEEISYNTHDNSKIIGEYGVGFLAAMAASDTVDVWSIKKGLAPAHWQYNKGNSTASLIDEPPARLSEAAADWNIPRFETGTLVICNISGDTLRKYNVDESYVRNSLEVYTSLLPVPVYYRKELITGKHRVWDNVENAKEEDWSGFIESFKREKPLYVKAIYSPPDHLDLFGVLWISENVGTYTNAPIDVYIKRMFVTEDIVLLKPQWASFVKGVVNGNKIRRIVSGNMLIQDENVTEAKKFITQSILTMFKEIAAKSQKEYNKIFLTHFVVIKQAALNEKELMDIIWDKLRFTSGHRMITITEYLAVVKNKLGKESTIYYYDTPQQELAVGLVSDSFGIPILCLCQDTDKKFIAELCKWKDLQLLNFSLLAKEFAPPENSDDFKSLQRACAINNITAQVRSFEPAHIPAMFIEDSSLNRFRDNLLYEVRRMREDNDEFADRFEQLLDQPANKGVDFYLNTSNELIQGLAKAEFEVQASICLALYHITYMTAMPSLKKSEVERIYDSISSVLENLLHAAEPRSIQGEDRPFEDNEKDQVCRPIRLFLMTPFDSRYTNVIRAIRTVFESAPYFFEVMIATDRTYESKLLPNVQHHMKVADGFIAEITDLNPNVMFELGAILAHSDDRPVFSLRGKDAEKKVPADFNDQLYISYGNAEDPVEDIVARIRSVIEKHGKPTHSEIIKLLQKRTCRALNDNMFRSLRLQLKEEEISAILKNYSTIETFLQTPIEEIAKKTEVSQDDIRYISNHFSKTLERSL